MIQLRSVSCDFVSHGLYTADTLIIVDLNLDVSVITPALAPPGVLDEPVFIVIIYAITDNESGMINWVEWPLAASGCINYTAPVAMDVFIIGS